MIFLSLLFGLPFKESDSASDTVGRSNTEAELVKVEGNITTLRAIPVNTP